MTTMVLSICGERSGDGWKVHRYAYIGDLSLHERPADAEFVNRLIGRLAPKEAGDMWEVDTRPPEGYDRFFDIYVTVKNHGKPTAEYGIDRRRYDGCPVQASMDGMAIFDAIKTYGIRPAMKQQREMKKSREARRIEANAERQRLEARRFQVGGKYEVKVVDGLGHLSRRIVGVTALLPKDGRLVFDVAGGRKGVVATVRTKDDGTETFTHREVGGTVSATSRISE